MTNPTAAPRRRNTDTRNATAARMERYWRRKEQEAAALLESRGWGPLVQPDGTQFQAPETAKAAP